MRAIAAPAVLLTLVAAACAEEAPTAVPSEAAGVHAPEASIAAAPQRPISGSCEAVTVEVQPISPTVLRRVSVGTCQLSHLGRTELLSIAHTNLVTLEQQAEHTFTAANGDLLYATSTGSGSITSPGTIHFAGVTTIDGGSGRFVQAEGVMQATGVNDMAAGSTHLSYDGWIRY